MSDADYYFINHTKKEYSCFDNSESIINCVEILMHNNVNWEMTDDIRVECCLKGEPDLTDFLASEEYVNADSDGPTESDGNSQEEGESIDDEMMQG